MSQRSREGRWLVAVLGAGTLLALAAGCESNSGGAACDGMDCSGHGTCAVEDGTAQCYCNAGYAGVDCAACASGYQDNDLDGTCVETCATASLSCGDYGHCEDTTGTPACVCDTGHSGPHCDGCPTGTQDNDGDGICLPDCAAAGLDCGTGMHCDDSTGAAACLCDDGTQDHDGDGVCTADCTAAVAGGLDCGTNGHCADGSGTAVCTCNAGYTGDDCADCAMGYQDNDTDGTCLPSCALTGLDCAGHGVCDDSSGSVVCTCQDGYQDNDEDGSCLPDCATAAPTCDANQECSDADGTAACVCSTGYQDHDGDGTCLADCTTAAPDCHGHGTCDDASGVALCACDTGYGRSDCGVCKSPYYQDHDGDGVCETTCYYVGDTFSCGDHQECSDATGAKTCVCVAGYQDNDADGTCMPTCSAAMADATTPLVCPTENGGCVDDSGTAVCACHEGYADDPGVDGDDCLACADGYQDNDEDGVCKPDCTTAVADGLSCGTLGCDDSSGTALCNCGDGLQDYDFDGTCAPDCAAAVADGLDCDTDNHEVCADASGTATCVCDDGFYDAGTGECLVVGSVGDNCDDPIDLGFPISRIRTDMTGMGSDVDFSCNDWGFPFTDTMYHFTVAAGETRHVVFDALWYNEETDTYFIPAIALFEGTDCFTASEVACGFGVDPDTYYIISASIDTVLDGGTSGADYWLAVGFFDYFGMGETQSFVDVTTVCGAGTLYSAAADACVDNPCIPDNPCTDTNKNSCVADVSAVTPTYTCGCNVGFVDDGSGTCVANSSAEGEACADVIPIDPSTVAGSVSGSTADATDDGEASCSGSKPAPDRVYGFTLTQVMKVALKLEIDDEYDGLMHLRSTCDDPDSEIFCYDHGALGDTEETSVVLQPGSYYLYVDGWNDRPDDTLASGDYTLSYAFHADPCADDDTACPGEQVCTAADDWSGFTCTCPDDGDLPYGTSCVADPCVGDPCADHADTHCVPDLAAGTPTCACDETMVDDGAGGCKLADDADWTIMDYWAMDNNLYTQSLPALDEWMSVNWNPKVRMLVLVDGYGVNSYIAEVLPGRLKVVKDFGTNVDTGDWHTLRDFGVWAVQHYPAKHYMLIPDDHGGEWRDGGPIAKHLLSDDEGTAGIIYVTNGDYGSALAGITAAAGRKLDMIVYDDCLQGEFEMAEATAPYASYMVASPSSQYGYRMGNSRVWDEWLQLFVDHYTTMSLRDMAETFIDYYRYDPAQYQTTAAAFDLGTIDDLSSAVSAFADALVAAKSSSFYNLLDDVRYHSQSHTIYGEEVDFWDFARRVVDTTGVPAAVVTAAQALIAQLDTTIVYNWSNLGKTGLGYSLGGSTGMTVYLPSRYFRMDARYTGYGAVWSHNTTWDEFVAGFATGTHGECPADGDTPALGYIGTTVNQTLTIETSGDYGYAPYILQTFRAPGRELNGMRIAVRKTVPDEMQTLGYEVSVLREDGSEVAAGSFNGAANDGTVQYVCLVARATRTTPGEKLYLYLWAAQQRYDYTGDPFSAPIEWPIEYAASADDDPPYADGEAIVNFGDGEQPIGEYNGDGIPGTLWFNVY